MKDINNRPTKKQKVEISYEPSILMKLDPEIWNIIFVFVSHLYYNALSMTCRKFHKMVGVLITKNMQRTKIVVNNMGHHSLGFRETYIRKENNPRVEYIQWAYENGAPVSDIAFVEVSLNGRIDIAKVLLEKIGKTQTHLMYDNATEKGHLNMIQFLHNHGKEMDKYHITTVAAAAEHVHILEWIEENMKIDAETRESYLSEAFLEGNTDVFEWANKKFDLKTMNYNCAYMYAVANDDLDFLAWTREKTGKPFPNLIIEHAWRNECSDKMAHYILNNL